MKRTKTTKDTDVWKWLASGVAKASDFRDSITGVAHSEYGMAATNGHHLRLARGAGSKDGRTIVPTTGMETGKAFPDIGKVMATKGWLFEVNEDIDFAACLRMVDSLRKTKRDMGLVAHVRRGGLSVVNGIRGGDVSLWIRWRLAGYVSVAADGERSANQDGPTDFETFSVGVRAENLAPALWAAAHGERSTVVVDSDMFRPMLWETARWQGPGKLATLIMPTRYSEPDGPTAELLEFATGEGATT